MLICFEGPDCAGKTTQVENLAMHIEKNYPGLSALYMHFPDHCDGNIDMILHSKNEDGFIVNPYYTAASYMCNFYRDIYHDRYHNGKNVRLIDLIKSKDNVVIFDRYYYSSLIMCTLWPSKIDNLPNSRENEEIRKKFKENLFGVVGLLLKKFELPAPDLNFVLIPSNHDYFKRIENKKKKDSFESSIAMMKMVYLAYKDATDLNRCDLFMINGEVLPPVVFFNNNNADISIMHNYDLSSLLSDKLDKIDDNTKNEEESFKIIRDAFDEYINLRRSSAESKLFETNDNLRNIRKSWNIEDAKDVAVYAKKSDIEDKKSDTEDKKSDVEDKRSFEVMNMKDVPKLSTTNINGPADKVRMIKRPDNDEKCVLKEKIFENKKEEKKEIDFPKRDELLTTKKDNSTKSDDFAKIPSLNDKEKLAIKNMGIPSVAAFIQSPEKYIPGEDYSKEDRIFCINLMIKILRSGWVMSNTHNFFKIDKRMAAEKYLFSLLEQIKVVPGLKGADLSGVNKPSES